MKKILLILTLLVCSFSFGQVNTQKSTQYIPQTSDIPSVTSGRFYFNDGLKKFKYFNGTEWVILDNSPEQDNKNQFVSVDIPLDSIVSNRIIAKAINDLPSFTVDDIHNIYIVATQNVIGAFPTQYVYILNEVGKGVYGDGGVDILETQLFFLNKTNSTLADVEADPSTQIVNLGVETGVIEDVFNAHTFTGLENPIQGQDEGYVIVNVNLNSTDLQYFFIGTGGFYGTLGDTLASAEDFILLTDILQSAETQFIDLGEVGDSLIEDVFNLQTPCVVVQNQEDGYVIVDITLEGTPIQYLFVGAGGSYGDGCDDTATAEDFIVFEPVVPPSPLPDLWRNRDNNQYGIAGQPTTNFLADMNHGALISATGLKLPANLGGTTLGISTDGFGPLPITGNYGIAFKGGNANHTFFTFISDGVATSTPLNTTRRGIYERRDYRSAQTSNNYFAIGFEANDFVNLSTHTSSKYASFRANPQVTGTGYDVYSYYADRGKVFLGDYGDGLITGTATYGAAFDTNGNLIEVALGGGGDSHEIYSESGTIGGGDGVATIGNPETSEGSGLVYYKDYSSSNKSAIFNVSDNFLASSINDFTNNFFGISGNILGVSLTNRYDYGSGFVENQINTGSFGVAFSNDIGDTKTDFNINNKKFSFLEQDEVNFNSMSINLSVPYIGTGSTVTSGNYSYNQSFPFAFGIVLPATVNTIGADFYGNIELPAYNIPYDNSSSGLTAINVQEAIDEIASSGGGGTGDLQEVAENGSVTTTSLTSTEFIDSDGTTASSGTVLDLSDNITGQIFNYATPSTANDFTTASLKRGGYVVNFIDTTGDADFPTLNSVNNPKAGAAFEADTIFQMIVTTYDGTNAVYYFLKYE